MPKSKLLTVERACTHCGALNEVTAPYVNYDRIDNKSCELSAEFADLDIVIQEECSDCKEWDLVYWHNSEAENKVRDEQRELLFFKTKYLSHAYLAEGFSAKISSRLDELMQE